MATAAVLGSTVALSKGVYKTEWNWTTTASGGSNPMNAPHLPEKTVQVHGPTGGDTSVIIQGSNVSAVPPTGVGASEWTTLTTPTDGELTLAGALNSGSLRVIRENPRYIRSQVSSVTEVVKVVVISR